MRYCLLSILMAFAVGCGDGNETDVDAGSTGVDAGPEGLDPARTIGSLTRDEARELCEEFVSALGGAGFTVTCMDPNVELIVQTVEECAATFERTDCTNTIAELNACIAALDGNACRLFTEAACTGVVTACATSD